MEIKIHRVSETGIAEIISNDTIIQNVQDALDLMANVDYNGARKIIVFEKNLNPDFFKLATGLAGEILQKFVNYKIQLAIIGDFSKFKSTPLKDFIRECNRGNQIYFLPNINSAFNKLS